jgi:sulfite reductase (NADPH) hemoprotein beta-component
MGRTPIVGHVIREYLPWRHMLTYCEAILRVYNRHGRRDNLYKARIKILVKSLGVEEFARQVDTEWEATGKDSPSVITDAEFARVAAHFEPPPYESLPGIEATYEQALAENRAFSRWAERNVHGHRRAGYASVTLSLKKTGVPPGDVTASQMEFVAELAELYSFGELRVSHEQNLILADVRKRDLFALWRAARSQGLATPNVGLLTNIVCCPGGDFCSLANAKSIPIAEAIQRRFDDLDYLHDIGELDLNISGCMNSCGHHHIGHIGILGVDKQGAEFYQVSIGGRQGRAAALGQVIGPSFAAAEMPDVVAKLIDAYLDHRHEDELFVDTVHRVGVAPFKARVYGETKEIARAA